MDLRTLRYCEAVDRLGSITRAAEVLHVAQPALSVAIKKLEEELGVTLFARHKRRGVVLTAEGRVLMRRAQAILAEVNSIRREIADAAELRRGEVRVGVPPMYGLRAFPPLIKDFHKTYPGLVITVLEGSAGEVGGWLDSGEIELAVLESRRIRSGWAHTPMGTDEMVICVHRNHALAAQGAIGRKEVEELPMAVFDESFIQRNLLDQWCQKLGVTYTIVVQSNYAPIVYQAALDGIGGATLLRSIVEADEHLVPLPLDPPEIMQFEMCWLDDRYVSTASRAFLRFVSERATTAEESAVPQ